MSNDDRCLLCHESRGAIRNNHFYCVGVDAEGEAIWEAPHHIFTHQTKAYPLYDPRTHAMWKAVCACGWVTRDTLASREDARIAAREHRSRWAREQEKEA